MTNITNPATAILKVAKAVIEDPKHWIQGDFAKDSSGISVSARYSHAVCFCALGALRSVVAHKDIHRPYIYLCEAANNLGYNSIPEANDEGGHAEVMGMYDVAIKLSEEAA